jgi:hypothetical protein
LAQQSKAINGTRKRRPATLRLGNRGAVREHAGLVSAREVSRSIPFPVQCLLWGRAAGRCEFRGCNQPLWKSGVTQEQVNIAQKAHIYSFASHGPRGNAGVQESGLHNLSNLMLVCHVCHRKIDQRRDGGRYPVVLLLQMKEEHERRIEQASAIAPEKSSHVLLYGANIGDHSSPLNYMDAAAALFPQRYPAAERAIELSVHNSAVGDRDEAFWENEAFELRRKFDRQVRARVSEGDIRHLSVFAIAPQPLLILLGSLLGDIVPADVYQRHREPTTWKWHAEVETPSFRIQRPSSVTGKPALVFEVSATVTEDRVRQVLGESASIWSIGVPSPHNDVVKSNRQKGEFRTIVRTVFDQIKAVHGQTEVLHIFPAMPISLAVELGRVRMPKADMPWALYDQINARGGFVRTLSIPEGGEQV